MIVLRFGEVQLMVEHRCINGRILTFDASAEVQAFLSEVAQASEDPTWTESAVRAFIFGESNPLWVGAGYSYFRGDVLEQPAFRVALDLLDRKRIESGTLNLDAATARYSMTVSEAAEFLGIRDSAVRTAVAAFRLPCWMKNGQIFLDPATVRSYQASRRGRPPQIRITSGSDTNGRLRVCVEDDDRKIAEPGGTESRTVETWTRVFAILDEDREQRCLFWELIPGGPERTIGRDTLLVEGRFTIVRHLTGAAAQIAWQEITRPSAFSVDR